jgi:hypothetical protein
LATGTLTRVAADTIVLTPPEGPDLIVPLDRILLVERSIRPERPYGGRQGFLIGAGVGVLALWSVIDATSPPDDINLYVSVILGFPLGGLIGAIVGSERAKEKWAPANLNPRPVEPAGR